MIRLMLALLAAATVEAHEISESFLRIDLRGSSPAGRWEISLRDAEIAVGVDANQDDQLTWEEVQLARPKLGALVRTALRFPGADGPAELVEIALAKKSGGNYLALDFRGPDREGLLKLEYDFMFPYDRGHRAILAILAPGTETTAILTAANRSFQEGARAPGSGFLEFARQGVIHIWEGTDHILFLMALLLPAVMQRAGEKPSFRGALVRVVQIVTAFTVAHSITLGLATLDVVRLPGRLVESVIAFSVLLAAANNIARFWNDRSWQLAFVFGLIHGFGFASVLSELDLEQANLVIGLAGFNFGVEAGQLAIVLAFFPVAFWIRGSWFYRRFVLAGGSAMIALAASVWIFERVFSVRSF